LFPGMVHRMVGRRRRFSRMRDRLKLMHICIHGTQNRLSRMKNCLDRIENFMGRTKICLKEMENFMKRKRFLFPGMVHRMVGRDAHLP